MKSRLFSIVGDQSQKYASDAQPTVIGLGSKVGDGVLDAGRRESTNSMESIASEPMHDDERAELESMGYVLPPPRAGTLNYDFGPPLDQFGSVAANIAYYDRSEGSGSSVSSASTVGWTKTLAGSAAGTREFDALGFAPHAGVGATPPTLAGMGAHFRAVTAAVSLKNHNREVSNMLGPASAHGFTRSSSNLGGGSGVGGHAGGGTAGVGGFGGVTPGPCGPCRGGTAGSAYLSGLHQGTSGALGASPGPLWAPSGTRDDFGFGARPRTHDDLGRLGASPALGRAGSRPVVGRLGEWHDPGRPSARPDLGQSRTRPDFECSRSRLDLEPSWSRLNLGWPTSKSRLGLARTGTAPALSMPNADEKVVQTRGFDHLDVFDDALDHQGASANHLNVALWLAAARCDAERVQAAISKGADVSFDMQDTDPKALNYKLRNVTCKPLHAASALRGHDDGALSNKCVEILLNAGAQVDELATIKTGGTRRQLQAIHIAAGCGNSLTVELLIKRGASPNAHALIDGEKHYCPIHDAAWFNRLRVVKVLLEQRASVEESNKDGETALHLAAKLGYVEMAEMFLHGSFQGRRLQRRNTRRVLKASMRLVEIRDKNGNRPLDLAVSRGQFPPTYLSLFTDCLSHKKKVDAFIKVAHACPSAAPALLRRPVPFGDEGQHVIPEAICPDWEVTLRHGADSNNITVNTLATLVEHAPQAAKDLLDALTVTPTVVNREANPLPIRANIPLGADEFRLAVAYEDDKDWFWDVVCNVGRTWHKDLAPPDPKGGREVQIKVLKLDGLISARLFHCLAEVEDTTIFTKVVLHGMLKYVWKQVDVLFSVDALHDLYTAVMMVVLVVVGEDMHDIPLCLRRFMWLTIATQSLTESINIAWGSVLCCMTLGKGRMMAHVKREATTIVSFIVTLALSSRLVAPCDQPLGFFGSDKCWKFTCATGAGMRRDGLFAAVVPWKWICSLYRCRGYAWMGRKVLPIFNAMHGIVGLLIVVTFCFIGFTTAFWSLDRLNINYDSFLNVFTLLVSGEHNLGDVLLGPSAWQEVILACFAVIFFSIIILNVFIAVLSDSYFNRKESLVSAYLRERARICTAYLFRPRFRIAALDRMSTTWRDVLYVAVVLATNAMQLVFAWSLDLIDRDDTPRWILWLAAVLSALWHVFLQAVAMGTLSHRWHEKSLWICHERHVSEDDFLPPDQREEIMTYKLNASVKQYVYEQCRVIALYSKRIWGVVDVLGTSLQQMEEQNMEVVNRLAEAQGRLEAVARTLASSASTGGTPVMTTPAGDSVGGADPPGNGCAPGSTHHAADEAQAEASEAPADPEDKTLKGFISGLFSSSSSKSPGQRRKVDTTKSEAAQKVPPVTQTKSRPRARSPATDGSSPSKAGNEPTALGSLRKAPKVPRKVIRRRGPAEPARDAIPPSASELAKQVEELGRIVKRLQEQMDEHAEAQVRLAEGQSRMERSIGTVADTLEHLFTIAKRRTLRSGLIRMNASSKLCSLGAESPRGPTSSRQKAEPVNPPKKGKERSWR